MPGYLTKEPFTYVEPFVGSGTVFFWFLRTFSNIKTAVINDVNKDLIDTYKTIKNSPEKIVKELSELESDYRKISSIDLKKDFFLEKRTLFNSRKNSVISQSS